MTYVQSQMQDCDERRAVAQHETEVTAWSRNSAERSLFYLIGARGKWAGRGNGYTWERNGIELTLPDAIREVQQIANDPSHAQQDAAARALATLDELDRDLNTNLNIVAAADREWDSHGKWARYIGVRGGRIHTYPTCGRVRDSTYQLWLPNLSGGSPQDAVTAYGNTLCPLCFPNVPKAWTADKFRTPDQIETENRRAAKEVERKAKLVMDPSTGEPLRGFTKYHWIRTERTAHNLVIEAMANLRLYSLSHPDAPMWEDYIERAIPAIAAKRGIPDTDALHAEYTLKADRRYRRERRDTPIRIP
jgi:hypothetical protein